MIFSFSVNISSRSADKKDVKRNNKYLKEDMPL